MVGVKQLRRFTTCIWRNFKGYLTEKVYLEFRSRYKECIRMLNGLEKTLERKVPEQERHWQISEESQVYGANGEPLPQGWPIATEEVS